MTNGEVMKKVYPTLVVKAKTKSFVSVDIDNDGYTTTFRTSWWDGKYQHEEVLDD